MRLLSTIKEHYTCSFQIWRASAGTPAFWTPPPMSECGGKWTPLIATEMSICSVGLSKTLKKTKMAWSMRTFTNRTFFNALIPFRTNSHQNRLCRISVRSGLFCFPAYTDNRHPLFTICLTGILSFTIFTAILK